MSTANTSQISLNARASRIGRTLALFFVSYSSAAILLGVVDTLVMVGRFGPTCDLSVPEIVGLPLLALKMPWALHLVLVLGGSLFLGIVELLPLRRTVRTAVLSLPLAAALAAGFFFGVGLPFFKSVPCQKGLSVLAALMAVVGVPFLVLILERLGRKGTIRRLALCAPLVAAMSIFAWLTCQTYQAMVRVPNTLALLVSVVYLSYWVLTGIQNVRWWVALVALSPVAAAAVGSYASTKDLWYRVDAAVAYRTNLTQYLLFAKLFLLGPAPTSPPCDTEAVGTASPAGMGGADMNLLLLTVDTFRPDHLAAYGYDRDTMPNLEQLIQESILFRTAYSAGPATPGSMFTLWTGTSAVASWGRPDWPPTLQQLLRNEGYSVFGTDLVGFIQAAGVPSPNGAERFDTSAPQETTATQLADSIIAFMREHVEQRFGVLAHFMEPHDQEKYSALPRHFPDRLWSRYDDALHYVDAQIGRILRATSSLGLWDKTAVIVSADHGEFLGEHGRLFHGYLLYEPLVRVPLVVHLPSSAARSVRWPVSGFDVAPTAYRVATGRHWPTAVMGDDLMTLLEAGPTVDDRAVFFESIPGRRGVCRPVAIRKGRWKYTALLATPVEELFDIETDTAEVYNVAGQRPSVLADMRRELDGTLKRRACHRAPSKPSGSEP